MKYIYASILLHLCGKKVDVEGIKKILDAAGATYDELTIHSVVKMYEGKDIGKIIEKYTIKTLPIAKSEPIKVEPIKVESDMGIMALFGDNL